MSLDKKTVHLRLLQSVQDKIDRLQSEMDELNESLTSSTKSSVGDKHETARAMLQIEQERIGNQLIQNQQMRDVLKQIDTNKSNSKITLGSLVKTASGYFYLSISGGQLKIGNDSVFCLSLNSPMGQALNNKSTGDEFQLNGKTFEIEEIK